MLDFLNERDIEENTVEGAKKALEILLRNYPERVSHSKKVAELAKEIASKRKFSQDEIEMVFIAALLHDIGYSDDFKFADFHPVDGYYYLMANGWSRVYQYVALFHTFSKELAEMSRKDLSTMYKDKVLTEEELEILDIVTEADFMVNGNGNIVSKEERLQDIILRYGENSLLTKHARMVYNKLSQKKIEKTC